MQQRRGKPLIVRSSDTVIILERGIRSETLRMVLLQQRLSFEPRTKLLRKMIPKSLANEEAKPDSVASGKNHRGAITVREL
jgi:hypothetical protein